MRKPAWKRMVTCVALLTVGTGLLGVACSQHEKQDYGELVAGRETPERHAIQSDELQEVMREIDTLALQRLPQEIDPEQARDRRIEKVAELADHLAVSASQIPHVVGQDQLQGDDWHEFVCLADKLRDQALELKAHAADRHVGNMERALESMTTTCNSCHSLFRGLRPVEGYQR